MSEPADLPSMPAAAEDLFGDQAQRARRYVELLASSGLQRGLIGPREVPRLWERHVMNSAVITELLGEATRVMDVGSGAGLPGIPLALAAPQLSLDLVEPMLRRTTWLTEVVAELGLTDRVRVIRARAEELPQDMTAPIVTARAVARLDTLASWCLPLVSPGGRLLALKGASAAQEMAATRKSLAKANVRSVRLALCGEDILNPPTRVVVVEPGTGSGASRTANRSSRSGYGRRSGPRSKETS